ncbi:MAG TPA: hypothetical protein VE465_11015 [Streptosporangiaceae bacterium]|jgi:hypothetical protein|nr:hypothetical protein [Streptosporangiaceae bacterium]
MGDRGRDSTEAYWRRRAIALGGVLTLAGLVAWGCAGGGQHPAERRSVHNAAALASPGAHSVPAVVPTATVTVTTRTTVRPIAPRKTVDACEPRDIVFGFRATKTAYAGKDLPRFRLTAVNTGRRVCRFGVGPKELEVKISSGLDRIWTSAQCARGSGSSSQMLRRGVPYITTVVWDRKRSSAGCRSPRVAARPGVYVAAVKAGTIKVRKQVFRLR